MTKKPPLSLPFPDGRLTATIRKDSSSFSMIRTGGRGGGNGGKTNKNSIRKQRGEKVLANLEDLESVFETVSNFEIEFLFERKERKKITFLSLSPSPPSSRETLNRNRNTNQVDNKVSLYFRRTCIFTERDPRVTYSV